MSVMLLMVEKIKIGGVEIIDFPNLFELFYRFLINLGAILLLVRWLYYSVTRRKDYMFTYLLISTVIFLLCFLLESVKLQLGFALGLFAIFGIIRYRTDAIPIKEMTYLFIVIGVSVINALVNNKTSIAEVLLTNGIIIFITYGYEKVWMLKHESTKTVIYERIDLIKPDRYPDLLADLQDRTGIATIKRVEVGRIDFLRDVCRLKIYYEESGNRINIADQLDVTDRPDDDD